jgi:hypothetical protein
MNSTSQAFDYVPTVTGSYSYKCNFHAAMGMTGSFTVSVLTGIDTPKTAMVLEIFPNPVVSSATVKMISAPVALKGLKIYDVTGKIVLIRDLADAAQIQSLTLDLGALGSGIYFALFEDTNNGITVKRIVKK